MKSRIKTYKPYLAEWGEADMTQHPMGGYVQYFEYMELYKKYIRARSALKKEKIKNSIKKIA